MTTYQILRKSCTLGCEQLVSLEKFGVSYKPSSPLGKAVGGNPKPWQPRPGYLAGSPLIEGTPLKNFLEVLFVDRFRFSAFLIMLYCNGCTVCSDIG